MPQVLYPHLPLSPWPLGGEAGGRSEAEVLSLYSDLESACLASTPGDSGIYGSAL